MFGAIGAVNRCVTSSLAGLTEVITINVDSLKVLSQTGNAYAKQFEQDAMLTLAQKRADLEAQQKLSKTLATQSGMTNKWFKEQGLLSVKHLWVNIHYPATAR